MDSATLAEFRILTKNDARCSTAVLEPNTPGLMTLKLSWIWQSVTQHIGPSGEHAADLATQLECERPCSIFCLISTDIFQVRRVHWLRAHAQHHQWEEERTLVRYEMQWTIQYFLFKSNGWLEAAVGHAQTGRQMQAVSSVSSGAAAYCHWQSVTWKTLAFAADHLFRINFPEYESPL